MLLNEYSGDDCACNGDEAEITSLAEYARTNEFFIRQSTAIVLGLAESEYDGHWDDYGDIHE